jgi:hypothetical protein
MRILSNLLAGSALGLIVVTLGGCPPPIRVCLGCTYKTATFSAVPTSNIESASLKAQVKHVGTCPQGSFPNDCTEWLSYNAFCTGAVGSAAILTLPMLVDAAPTNPNRTATLTVKLRGNPNPVVLNGTIQTGNGSSVLLASPCPPPTIDPYVTLPNVL